MQTGASPDPTTEFPASAASANGHALARAVQTRALLVVAFCAAWCDSCGSFKPLFEEIAAAHRDRAFVWLDIEDDADVAGDIDVEDFPTIAIFHQRRLVHFGPSLPIAAVVSRLVASIDAASRPIAEAGPLCGLPERLIHMKPEAAHRALLSS